MNAKITAAVERFSMRARTGFLVIGTLADDPAHEFGEYDSLREARRVWFGHDDQDGPVFIFDAAGNNVA